MVNYTLTEKLALDRTSLANERTFLAYFRTFIVFLSSGLAIVKLEMLQEIKWMGFGLITISPFLFAMGLFRYFRVKKRLRKYNPEDF